MGCNAFECVALIGVLNLKCVSFGNTLHELRKNDGLLKIKIGRHHLPFYLLHTQTERVQRNREILHFCQQYKMLSHSIYLFLIDFRHFQFLFCLLVTRIRYCVYAPCSIRFTYGFQKLYEWLLMLNLKIHVACELLHRIGGHAAIDGSTASVRVI